MTKHFYANLALPSPSNKHPFIAINMVNSIDGRVTSGGTLSPGSLGSAFDRQTMNVIRSHFDAVLAGGNTIRQHPFYLGIPRAYEKPRIAKGLASQPLTVLLTKSGQLDPNSPLFTNPPRPPLILTSAQGKQALAPEIKEKSTIEVMGDHPNPETIASLLYRKYGINHLLVEGGPSVNYQFLQEGLVNELFITLAPRVIGAQNDLTMVMGQEVLPPIQITLLSCFEHNSELFLRYELSYTRNS